MVLTGLACLTPGDGPGTATPVPTPLRAELAIIHPSAILPAPEEPIDPNRGVAGAAPALVPRIPGLPELACDLERLQADFDIPIEVNASVVRHLREYQSLGSRRGFLRWLSIARQYDERYRAILKEHGVPGDLVYLAMIESGFATHATSPAGAVGPWQLIATTGRQFGLRQDRWVDERRDPEKAARAAARFLRSLHARLGDWHLAWAAYNTGPERVARMMRRGYSGFWDMERRGVLSDETRAYVAKIIAAAILARHAEAFGLRLDELRPRAWVHYELVVIPRSTPLSRLAAAAGVSVRTLRELNPELRRNVTPPRPYALKIPRASAGAFAENWPRIWSRKALLVARERAPRATPHARTARGG